MKTMNDLMLRLSLGLACVALVAGCGGSSPEKARAKLEQLGQQVTPSAFSEAVRQGDVKAVELFLRAGMDGNTRIETDRGDMTMLQIAALYGNREVASLLLDKGADANAVSSFGRSTPLQAACGQTNLALTSLLLERGANVNAANEDGATPLLIAVAAKNLNAVDLLLRKSKPDLEYKVDGLTALDVARQSGREDIVEPLRQAGTRN